MFFQKIGLQVRLCWTWLESSCFADVDLPWQEKTQIGTGVFWLVQPSIEHFHPSPDFSSLVWFSLKLLSGDCVADLGVYTHYDANPRIWRARVWFKNGGCQKMVILVMKMMRILWNLGAVFSHGQDGPNAGVRDCRQHVRHRRDFA